MFKYKVIKLSYKVYVYTRRDIDTWVLFINPDVSWGWGFGGTNVHDNGTVWFWLSNNVIKKYSAYRLNEWNEVKVIFYPRKGYVKNYINGRLIYEAWVRDDGYSVKLKVYPPNEEPFEYIYIPKAPYRDPHAYEGLRGIHIGDCSIGNDDIPAYYDDFLIIGYK